MARETTPPLGKEKLEVPGLTNLPMDHSMKVKTRTSNIKKDSIDGYSTNDHECNKATGIIHLDGGREVSMLLT